MSNLNHLLHSPVQQKLHFPSAIQNSPPHSPCDPCALTSGAPAPHFFVAVSAATLRYHPPRTAPQTAKTAQPKPAKPPHPRPALAILAQHCGERSDLAIPSPQNSPPHSSCDPCVLPLRPLRYHHPQNCAPRTATQCGSLRGSPWFSV